MFWWVCGKWDLLPVDGMRWLDDGMLEGREALLLYWKVRYFLLVWTPTEAFVLVGVWTMSSDWSGYEGWTMYPDWSELTDALWLVRVWWLKICELNRELWLVRIEDWKYVSRTMSCDWSELDGWILKADWSQPHGWKLNPDWLILIMYL